MWFYSLLLVIPLGACAVYYQYGRTDMALVHSEVNSNIAPIKQVIEQTKPALAQLRQTADQLNAQQARLTSLDRQQEALAATVQGVPEKLQEISSIKADLSQQMGSIQALNKDFQGSLENTRNGVAQLNERISGVSQQQTQIERGLKDLSFRVERIRPANNDDQLRRQQEVIDNLRERIQKLEQTQRVNPRTERPQ